MMRLVWIVAAIIGLAWIVFEAVPCALLMWLLFGAPPDETWLWRFLVLWSLPGLLLMTPLAAVLLDDATRRLSSNN